MSVKPSDLRKVATFITWAAIEPRNVEINSPTSVGIHLLGGDQLHVLARLSWHADSGLDGARFEFETAPTFVACNIGTGSSVYVTGTFVRAGVTYSIGTAVINKALADMLRDKVTGLRHASPHVDHPVTLDLLRELAAERVPA